MTWKERVAFGLPTPKKIRRLVAACEEIATASGGILGFGFRGAYRDCISASFRCLVLLA
jgi:hypothetical protein